MGCPDQRESNPEKKMKKLMELFKSSETAFLVAYDKNGVAYEVVPAETTEICNQTKPPIQVKDVVDLDEPNMEIITDATVFVHGSPGCWIRKARVGWVYIC